MSRELVGLVPAAGTASRLGPLPCSKEIIPVTHPEGGGWGGRTIRASEFLIERLGASGVRRTFVVIREGKWDIPVCLGDGRRYGTGLAYLTVPSSPSVPFTLDAAYPFIRDRDVAFGFPDILFDADDAFSRLLMHRKESRAEVVLGAFPAARPEKADLVQLHGDSRVVSIAIKPSRTNLRFAWIIAVWGPTFSEFLHDWVSNRDETELATEAHLGNTIRSALDAGLLVEAVTFDNARYLDIGTPDDLQEVVRWER